MMDGLLMKLAGRGYGWYLALKISKAAMAIPYFPVFLVLMALLAAGIACVEGAKGGARIGAQFVAAGAGYWQRNWFKGFGRSHYNGLRHYQRKATP